MKGECNNKNTIDGERGTKKDRGGGQFIHFYTRD
jgi:hypothetical protein